MENRPRDSVEKPVSEVLRVISQSPIEVQPVFEAIAGSAVRLVRMCRVAETKATEEGRGGG